MGYGYFERWSEYPSVSRLRDWFADKAGGYEWVSANSMKSYIEAVRNFVLSQGFEDPEALLEALRSGDVVLVEALKKWRAGLRGRAPSTQIRYFSSLKTFLEINDVDWTVGKREIALPKRRTIVEDRQPTKEELRRLLSYATLRLKVMILLLITTGLRIGTLIGLRMGDVIFEYDPYNSRSEVLKNAPQLAMIVVPPELSKSRYGYFAFVTPEAKVALREYLAKRERKGEKITRDSPLIAKAKGEGFNSYQNISLAYQRLLKRAGFKEKSHGFHVLHLHTLRKFFRTQADVLTKSQRERLMGHLGDYLDGAYFKPLDTELLSAYQKILPRLTIMEDVLSDQVRKEQLMLSARIWGFSEEKLKRIEEILARMPVEEAVEEIRKLRDPEVEANGGGLNYRIMHGEEELIKHVNQSWMLVKELSNDRYLIRSQK